MTSPSGDPEGIGEGTKYLALGLRFAGGVVLFLLLGLGIDRWLHLTPVGTVVGAILGAVLSTLSAYREISADPRNRSGPGKGKGGSGR
jgi:F0F1-type ATP synthase assembly protein I